MEKEMAKEKNIMITANPDIKIVDYNSECDFVIIGCDGIWDCLTNQEACDFVAKRLKETPEIKISKIIEETFLILSLSDGSVSVETSYSPVCEYFNSSGAKDKKSLK